MPKVHRVIISWRFNFFAEALLAQLAPAPTWLFHVDKTEQQLRAFQCPEWVGKTVVVPGQVHHSRMLERILGTKEWPALVDADVLVFMDHDFLMRPGHTFWSYLGQRLVSGVTSGHPVSARTPTQGNPMVCYTTIPAFAVNPRYSPWPHSWCGCHIDGVYCDTGQKIARAMPGQLDVFDWARSGAFWHWGSRYTTFNDKDNPEGSASVRAKYAQLGRTGHWKVGSADIDRVHMHPLLQDAFNIMYRNS